MATAIIEVLATGTHTSIQCLNHDDWYHPHANQIGAIDCVAAFAANTLLGQHANTPLLEITHIGPTLKFSGPSAIALSGAELPIQVGQRRYHSGTCIPVRAGQTVHIGKSNLGYRGYLAIKGGVRLFPEHRALTAHAHQSPAHRLFRRNHPLYLGQRCAITPYYESPPKCQSWIGLSRPITPVLAVCEGAHSHRIEGGFQQLCQQPWQLEAQQPNRQRLRLYGEPITHQGVHEPNNNGTYSGRIQLPPNGLPLLLSGPPCKADRHLQIAQISPSSTSLMAQLHPRQELWLEPIDRSEAQRRLTALQQCLKRFHYHCGRLWQ